MSFAGILRLPLSPADAVRSFYRDSLYRNAAYLILNSAVSGITGFIFWVVVARFYPTAQVGLASALIAATGLVNSISLLGFDAGLIRFLPEEKDQKGMINSCLTLVGISAGILAIIFVLGTPLWSPAISFLRGDPLFLLAFVVSSPFICVFAIQAIVFIAFRASSFYFAQNALLGVLKLAFPIFMVSTGVFGIFFSWGLATLICLPIGVVLFLRRFLPDFKPRPIVNKTIVGRIAHYSAGNYLAQIISTPPVYVLPIIVVNVLGAESSAYFRIAYGLGALLWAFPLGVATSLFAEGSTNRGELRAHTIRAIKFILFFFVPGLLFILFLGDKILLLFGREYSENAFSLLRWFAISSVLVAVTELYAVIKRVELQIKAVICLYASISVVVTGTCFFLMKYLGLAGVGVGWVAGYGATALVSGVLIARWLRSPKAESKEPTR